MSHSEEEQAAAFSALAPGACVHVSGAGVSRALPRRERSFCFRGSSRSLAKGLGVFQPRVGLRLPRAEAVGTARPLGAAQLWLLCRWRWGAAKTAVSVSGALRSALPVSPPAPPPPCCPPRSLRGPPWCHEPCHCSFVCVPLEAVAGLEPQILQRGPQHLAERMRFINARLARGRMTALPSLSGRCCSSPVCVCP